jgi:uncharacterized membrane protein
MNRRWWSDSGGRGANQAKPAIVRAKKENTNKPKPGVNRSSRWLLIVRVLLAVAALGAGYLAWVSIHNGPAAGCGPESGCSKVLQSRWAYWFGIPVGLPALCTYLGLLAATVYQEKRPASPVQQRAWTVIIVMSVVIAGAAVWFVGLQIFVIKAFCKFCMSAHVCALAAAVLCLKNIPTRVELDRPAWANRSQEFSLSRRGIALMVVAGLAGLSGLLAGQLLVQKQRNVVKPLTLLSTPQAPPLATTRHADQPVLGTPPATSSLPAQTTVSPPVPSTRNTGMIAQLSAPRLLSLYSDRFLIHLDEVPIIGSPDAPHLVVSLFDYTCHHCRQLHPFLVEAQRRLSNQLAIVSLPMPLGTNCNPMLPRQLPRHAKACDYARLALAVWRCNRELFPRFDDWLFTPETPVPPEQARQYAAQLVGPDRLERALADEWITRHLHTNGCLYHTNYLKMSNSVMPQLIIGPVISFGPLNSSKDLLLLLEQHLGLKDAR